MDDYNPDFAHIPLTREEVTLAVHDRPQPTPYPAVGDVVWYRAQPHGDLVEAVVEAIQDPNVHPGGEPDPNVWYRDNQTGAPLHLLPDPWLTLTLDTVWHDESGQAQHMRLTCREARARGSVGWLPADWDGELVTEEQLAEIPARFYRWQMSR